MQSYSRKRRSDKRARKFRGLAFACFSVILLTSCGLISKPTKLDKEYYKNEKKVKEYACLSSNGRGRIRFHEEKEQFTYQSESKKDGLWLGVDIPFKDQEVLVLPYGHGKMPSGSLYEKMSKKLTAKRKFKSLQVLDGFLKNAGRFFDRIDQMQKGTCKKSSCLPGILLVERKDLTYEMFLTRKSKMEISFSDINNGHYSRMSVAALSNGGNIILKMDLKVDKCL